MSAISPAAAYYDQRHQLDWALRLLEQQPDDLRQDYRRAGRVVAQALTTSTYRFSLDLPRQIALEGTRPTALSSQIRITAGSLLGQWRKISCHDAIIARLSALAADDDPALADSVRLVMYSAADVLLTEMLPPLSRIEGDCAAFDNHERLLVSESLAEPRVQDLIRYVHWLHMVGQLYPPWTTSDRYNDLFAHLTAFLIQQGRALARLFTDQLIKEVSTSWKTGDLARGLTLYVPYLDERTYQIARYAVLVTPGGRIPFRPQFVVSACRVAEREVRNHPALTQSTRWQLLARLDQIIQAFAHIENTSD